MQTTYLNTFQIDYLLDLLHSRSNKLREEHTSVLRSKHTRIEVVHNIIDAMEQNNQLISDLERMKKEV